MTVKQLTYSFISVLVIGSVYFSQKTASVSRDLLSLQEQHRQLLVLENQAETSNQTLTKKLHILQNNLVEIGSDTLVSTSAAFLTTGVRIPLIEGNPPPVKPYQYTHGDYHMYLYKFSFDAPITSDSDNIQSVGEAIGIHGAIFPDGYEVEILKFGGGNLYIPRVTGLSSDIEAIPVTLFPMIIVLQINMGLGYIATQRAIVS